MVIVTAIPSFPCSSVTGNYVNLASIKNKQDYAHQHGYAFYWTSETVDPTLLGAWNKVAVLLELMRRPAGTPFSRAEWLLWLDYDTLVANTSAEIPFAKYDGKHLVVWGDHQKMLADYDAQGTNTGVLLVRNSPAAYALLSDLADLGRGWDQGTSEAAQRMRSELRNFVPGLYDQNGLVYLAKQSARHRRALFLESLEGSYGLHSHFVANLPLTMIDEWGLPLVVHYAGCQFCTQQGHTRSGHWGLHHCLKHFFAVASMATNLTKAATGERFNPVPVRDLIYGLEQTDPSLNAEFKQRRQQRRQHRRR